MQKATTVQDLIDWLDGVVSVAGSAITVQDEFQLPDKIEYLVNSAVFSEGLTRDTARWLIWEIAQEIGVYVASIHDLYMEIGSGKIPPAFTVPAMNIRAMNFNTSCAVFRAAIKYDAGAMLFEIARSEMGYTDQRPLEYTVCILGAAIKEIYRGPIFIQGDHFQVSAARFQKDAEAEIQAIKNLMDEAVAGGFYNIDIDTSTLVDLSYDTLDAQQKENYKQCAILTKYARSIEPDEITISLGGEIGEVGHKNSTVEELRAFMQGYLQETEGCTGISKISVQTGTSHGGVVLADGSLADVKVDFDTLRDLSKVAREEYGLGGAVQHGASTLPAEMFHKFPEVGTVEIHLATGFQNIIYDHLPPALVEEAYNYLRENLKGEWKEGMTEDQFLYKTRKKAIGPFKEAWWSLDEDKKAEIGAVLQAQFEFLFEQLNIRDTLPLVTELIPHVPMRQPRPTEAAIEAEAEDVSDLDD
ncbi:MAG TPA: aldolase [Anaerolineae bacterium]|nr:aldolase [Anaerolineae bacterium]